MIHEIKILPEYFEEKLKDNKRWELRIADRPYEPGDMLILREWTPAGYTGRYVEERITTVYKHLNGIMPGYVMMSTRGMKEEDEDRYISILGDQSDE